jgi:hypothetical protein
MASKVGKQAPFLAGIPVVASTTERDALFPTPDTDQRVMIRATGDEYTYTGSAWFLSKPGAKGGVTGLYDVAAYNVVPGNSAALNSTNLATIVTAVSGAGGGTILFSAPGTYSISSAFSPPANSRVVMVQGATLSQTTETVAAISIGSDGVILENPTVKHATTTTRRTNGLIEVVAANHWRIYGGEIKDAAGLGLYVARSTDGRVFGARKTGVGKADAFHVTNGGGSGHVSKNIKFFGCHAEDTDDDSFAVVSYTGASQAIVEDVEFHGCHSLRSGARGFTLIGKGLRVFGGSVIDCAGSQALDIILDETAVTFNPDDVQVHGLRIGAATGTPTTNRFATWIYRAKNVKLVGVVSDQWGGGDSDIKVSGSVADYSEDIELASCRIKGVTSTGGNLLIGDRVRRLRVHHTKFEQGYKLAWNISNYEDVRFDHNEVSEMNYQNSGANNLATLVNGATYTECRHNTFAHTSRAITHGVSFSTITGPVYSQDNDYTGVTATLAGQLESVVSTAAYMHGISTDLGNTDFTWVPGTHPYRIRLSTARTANRTITAPTIAQGARHGMRVEFFAYDTGAFTYSIFGVKTIASATAARVAVEYDGRAAAWREVDYAPL